MKLKIGLFVVACWVGSAANFASGQLFEPTKLLPPVGQGSAAPSYQNAAYQSSAYQGPSYSQSQAQFTPQTAPAPQYVASAPQRSHSFAGPSFRGSPIQQPRQVGYAPRVANQSQVMSNFHWSDSGQQGFTPNGQWTGASNQNGFPMQPAPMQPMMAPQPQAYQASCSSCGPGGYGPGYGPTYPGVDGYVDSIFQGAPGCNGCGVYGDNWLCEPQGGCWDQCQSCGPSWYVRAGGLLLTRDRGKLVRTSYDTNHATGTMMDSHDVAIGWGGGAEVSFGRMVTACHAVEFSWWSLFDQYETQSLLGTKATGSLDSPVDFSALELVENGLTAGIDLYYDGAKLHRLRHSFQANNFEVNLLRVSQNRVSCCGCANEYTGHYGYGHGQPSCWDVSWMLGLRYTKLDQGFFFDTDDENTTFGDPTGEVFYILETENTLLGFQVGCDGRYYWSPRFSLEFMGKMGLYGSHITHHQQVQGCTIGPAVVNVGPHTNRALDLNASKQDVAAMGEFRLGFNYSFTPCAAFTFSYRAVGFAGVAQPQDQIPQSFANVEDILSIDSHSSLILHGFMFGFEWRR